MSNANKFFSTALALCIFCLVIWGCGGQADRSISNLDPLPESQAVIEQAPIYGTGIRFDPDAPQLIHLPPTDPWGIHDLGLAVRSASTANVVPTMDELQARLDEEFYRIGKDPAKVTAAVPIGNGNTVFNLVAEAVGTPITGVRLTWTERVIGDYDQNSEVNISDLTPIAVNIYATPNYDPADNHGGIGYWPTGDPDAGGADNWRLGAVDGDGNGEINLADIAGIAVHYKERLDGYRIYRRVDGAGSFTMIANITDPGAAYTIGRPTTPANAPVRYLFEDTGATSGNVEYYVAAYDDTVAEEGGQSNPVSVQLSQGPTAVLDVDETEGFKPHTVNFDAGGSNDPDGTLGKYEFDFGEGDGFEDFGATFLADNEYEEIGTYTAVVRVTDNEDNTDVAARVITVNGQEPVALLGLDTDFGEAPLLVNFDAISSTDVDGTIETYEFDFGQGGGFDEEVSPTPQFMFSNSGTYTVRLRVTDDDGLQNIYSRNVVTYNPGELVLPPLWEVAKANAEVSGSTMGFAEIIPGQNFNEWTWSGGYVDQLTMLPSFWEAWYTDVEAYPSFLNSKSQDISNAGGLQDLFLEANSETLVQHNILPQTHNSILSPTDPLAQALFDLATVAGGTPDLLTLQGDVAGLLLPERQALAELVDATQQALELRESTVLPFFLFDDFGYAFMEAVFDGAHGAGDAGLWALRIDPALMYYNMYVPDLIGVQFFRAFPYNGIYEGTAILADAIDTFSAYVTTNPTFGLVNIELDTPQGRITIGGTGPDTHVAPAGGNGHILLIDLGGDDIYDCHSGANASEYNGTSVCIDISGNDTYNNLDDPDDFDRSVGYSDDNTAQQGTGKMGIGMLVDFAGIDSYTGVRMAQGCAVFGAGILADYGGQGDTYSFEALGQGGAFGGIGLLYDDGGSDNYTCYSMAQGYGGVYGVGYLVDAGAESDTYLAVVDMDPFKPEYIYLDNDGLPANGTNMSIAQGAAWGIRREWLNLFSGPDSWKVIASGGQGLLFDEGGSDSYTGGTFAQGLGLYEGMGVLIDQAGDDVHSGAFGTQGAAFHAAVGGVLDILGNDTWDNEASVGLGGAFNMSVSWFFDIQGNDIYNASGMAVGTGDTNAFGYFLDYFGDDTYNATYSTSSDDNLGIGKLGDGTPLLPSYGIFIDANGMDTYDPGYQGMLNSVGLPGDGQQWTRVIDFVGSPDPADDKQGHGAGVDGPLDP